MSKQNKVNKNNYVQGGRLTPDDMARERMNQGEISHSKSKENVIGKMRHSPDGPAASRPQTSSSEEE